MDSLSPSSMLNSALTLSSAQQHALHARWIRVSLQSGSRELLFSQSDCNTDLLLRSMETETHNRIRDNIYLMDNHFTMQCTLSKYWILSWYEVNRKIHEKSMKTGGNFDRLGAIRYSLELVRVPLAKLRIMHEHKIKDPIFFGYPGEDPKQAKAYSGKEPFDYYPTMMVNRMTGSVAWKVYDRKAKSDVEIARRDISDEILQLWAPV